MRWAVAWGILLVAGTALADAGPFTFPIPEGFVTLDEVSSPAPPMSPIDERYLDEAKKFESYAVHVGPGGVDASYMTKVFSGTVPLANFSEFARKALTSSSGQDVKVLSTRLVDVSGLSSGRVELETRDGDVESRHLLYLLSGGDHYAVVKIVATKDEYDDAAAKLEAMLPQIHGLAAPVEPPARGLAASDEAQAKWGLRALFLGLCGYLGKKLRRLKPRAKS